jgi:putative spermidine/putrescine transport system substrate-binding protein
MKATRFPKCFADTGIKKIEYITATTDDVTKRVITAELGDVLGLRIFSLKKLVPSGNIQP